jgi:heme exporter protein B
VNVLLAILWKDLLIEVRSRDRVIAMLVFSLLVVVVFHFALPGSDPEQQAANAPGLLWVAYVFSALLGLGRAFSLELENEALSGLARVPTDRGWVFLGKAAANFVILAVVQFITACAFALAFEVDLAGVALPLAGIVALGSLGLCSVGTLAAAVAVRTRFREVMLPLLLLPLLWPILAGAVRATSQLVAGTEIEFGTIQLLIVTDGIYLVLSFLGFDFVLDE